MQRMAPRKQKKTPCFDVWIQRAGTPKRRRTRKTDTTGGQGLKFDGDPRRRTSRRHCKGQRTAGAHDVRHPAVEGSAYWPTPEKSTRNLPMGLTHSVKDSHQKGIFRNQPGGNLLRVKTLRTTRHLNALGGTPRQVPEQDEAAPTYSKHAYTSRSCLLFSLVRGFNKPASIDLAMPQPSRALGCFLASHLSK